MNLKIDEIQIVPIKPNNGLVGFASFVINNQFYLGNIAIYTSPSSEEGFRLVFPIKKIHSGQVINCCYPINNEVGKIVTSAIIKEYQKLMIKFV